MSNKPVNLGPPTQKQIMALTYHLRRYACIDRITEKDTWIIPVGRLQRQVLALKAFHSTPNPAASFHNALRALRGVYVLDKRDALQPPNSKKSYIRIDLPEFLAHYWKGPTNP